MSRLQRRRGLGWRGWVSAAALMGAVACQARPPEVNTSSPEDTARSLGLVLCAEHQQRIDAIARALPEAQALQGARAQIISDSADVRAVNERLEGFAAFFKTHREALRTCEVILVDKLAPDEQNQAHVALKVRHGDWQRIEPSQALEARTHEQTMLLTITQLGGQWQITASSHDLVLPTGALRSLLD
jgi:hypothetical protein